MITRREIDFTDYKQTFKFIKPDLLSRIFVAIFRLFKINTTTYKLDFFERMLNFIRITGFSALSENLPLELKKQSASAPIEINHEKRVSQSFVEFLYQFRIIISKKDELIINERYKRFDEKGAIGKILNDQAVDRSSPVISFISTFRNHTGNDMFSILKINF